MLVNKKSTVYVIVLAILCYEWRKKKAIICGSCADRGKG